MSDILDLQPGADLKGTQYRVVRRIGAGGMGVVYEIEHVRLKKRFAAKMLHPAFQTSDQSFVRMETEAQTLAHIAHPNIVSVHDLGVTTDGIPFFVMEKLEGTDLRRLLRKRRFLELDEALVIAVDILEALAHAHREGLVHRDIKPENIFLAKTSTGTLTKLLDFGIVKVLDDARDLTGEAFLGTPQYASPEQLAGKKATDKTDLYAVGCVLFELITGRRVFPGPTTSLYMIQHMQETAPRLSTLAHVPPALDAIIASALEKDPALRPADALGFASQLHELRKVAHEYEALQAQDAAALFAKDVTEAASDEDPHPAARIRPAAGRAPAPAAATPPGRESGLGSAPAPHAPPPVAPPPGATIPLVDAHVGAMGPVAGAPPLSPMGDETLVDDLLGGLERKATAPGHAPAPASRHRSTDRGLGPAPHERPIEGAGAGTLAHPDAHALGARGSMGAMGAPFATDRNDGTGERAISAMSDGGVAFSRNTLPAKGWQYWIMIASAALAATGLIAVGATFLARGSKSDDTAAGGASASSSSASSGASGAAVPTTASAPPHVATTLPPAETNPPAAAKAPSETPPSTTTTSATSPPTTPSTEPAAATTTAAPAKAPEPAADIPPTATSRPKPKPRAGGAAPDKDDKYQHIR